MSTHPTVKGWLVKDREELDAIYREAEAGTIPNGGKMSNANFQMSNE